MKTKISLFLSIVALMVVAASCPPKTQRTVYNSLYTLEKGVTTAFDAYLDQVVAGKADRLKLPPVAKAYDNFQASMTIAIAAAQYNWQAPAGTNVTTMGTEVLNEIRKAKEQ